MTTVPTLIALLTVVFAFSDSQVGSRVRQLAMADAWRLLVWPMLLWFVVCLFLGVWHLGFARKTFPENAFRISLILFVLALPVRINSKKWWSYGLVFGGLGVASDVAYDYWLADAYWHRISGTTNHPIHFGNFSCLLAVMLLTMVLLNREVKNKQRLIFVGAAILACVGVVASMTRSSLLVFFCLVPLLWLPKADLLHKWATRITAALTMLCVVFVLVSPQIQQKLRITEVKTDIELTFEGNYQSSIGTRLSMWQAAWLMWEESPLLGIGPSKFQGKYGEMVLNRTVPMGDLIHNQPHNDILHAASSGGVLKLMSYVFLIAGPYTFFYRRYKKFRFDFDKRVFPIMGMQVVAAFFITGLTNSNFDLQIYSTMYAVLVCVLAKLTVFEINEAEPTKPLDPTALSH